MSIFVSACIFLVLATAIDGQGLPQTLNFFKNDPLSCSTENLLTTVTTSRDDLEADPEIQSATTHNMVGLWELSQRKGSESVNILYYSKDEDSCNIKEDGYIYSKVRTYGGMHQTEPEISFFTDESFRGVELKATKENVLNLKEPIMMLSWLFTGNHSWSIFENIDFTGDVTCIQADPEKLNQFGEGSGFSVKSRLPVGSVKFGCSSGSGNSAAELEIKLLALLGFFVLFARV